ncbi:MAG: TolC family protein [Planctomycetota bacterium]|jgi:outer membrane protein TolC
MPRISRLAPRAIVCASLAFTLGGCSLFPDPETLQGASLPITHAPEADAAWLEQLGRVGEVARAGPSGLPHEGRALTLFEACELARQRSPALALAREELHRAYVTEIRAWGETLPRFYYTFGYARQDRGAPSLAGGQRVDELLTARRASRFEARQWLFRGGAPYFDVAAAQEDRLAESFAVLHQEQLVILRTGRLFFDGLAAEQAVALARTARASAEAEPQDSSALRLAKARERDAELWAEEARAQLAIQLGRPSLPALEAPALSSTKAGQALAAASLATLVEAALLGRADLEVARYREESAQLKVLSSFGGLFPTLEVVAGYYHDRNGLREPVDWDVALEVDVGIFEGWSGSAHVARTASLQRATEARSRLLADRATRAVTEAFFAYRRAEAMERALTPALEDQAEADPEGPGATEIAAIHAAEALGKERLLFVLALTVAEDWTRW